MTVSEMENDNNVSVLVVAIEKLTEIAEQDFGGQSTDDLLKSSDGISKIYPHLHVGDCPPHLTKLPDGLVNGILILESVTEKTDREYWFLGKAYEAKEEMQKSYEYFSKAIQYKPYDPIYVHEYINSAIRVHNYLDAINASTRLLASKPIDEIDDANYFDHCLCLYVNRRLVEAMEMINRRKWEWPQYPRAVRLRGKIIQLGEMIPTIGSSIKHLVNEEPAPPTGV